MAAVTDDFNRANGGLGSNWTTCPAHSALSIVSNKVQASATSTFCAALWNASSFANDQFSQATVGTASTSGGEAVGVIVRAKAGVDEFYLGFVTSSQYQIYKRQGGSYALLISAGGTSAPGDVIKLEATGSSPVAVNLYKNGVSQTSLNATGADIITGGNPGILIYDTGHSLSVDDWASTDAGAVTVTVNLTGVSASPAIGVVGFNVSYPLGSVSATPVIGTGAVTLTGTVVVNLSGVAATPTIGTGTVAIEGAVVEPPPVTPGGGTGTGRRARTGMRLRPTEDKAVYLKGVVANPQVGQVMLLSEMRGVYEKYVAPIRRAEAQKPAEMPAGMRGLFKKVEKPIPPAVFVYQVGLPKVKCAVGTGKVNAHYEEIDEEVIAMIDLL